jgi:hypothetical protein
MENRVNGAESRARTLQRRGVEDEEGEADETGGEGETEEAGGEGEPCDSTVQRLQIRLRAAGLPVPVPKATLAERLLSAGSARNGMAMTSEVVDVGGDDAEARTPSSVRTVRRALGTPGSVRPVQWGVPSNSDDWDTDSTDSNSDSTSYEQDF